MEIKPKWFRHEIGLIDISDLNEAIDKYGFAAYGMYCFVLEQLAKAQAPVTLQSITSNARKYNGSKEELADICTNYKLFNFDEETQLISCDWLNEVLEEQRRKAQIAIENGKRGGRPPLKPTANPIETQQEPNRNPVETQSVIFANPVGTQSEPNGNPVETELKPNRIELNRIEENRIELNGIEQNLREKKDVASGKPKAKLKKEVLEGFYIEEKKEGQPHLRQIAAYDDPAIIEWLGKNWEASFSIQQAWLNNNKSAVWKLWQTFFETNKMLYRDTWAGLHSHFCRYLKKASQREFEAKPQKPIKPPVESNRPEEPRRRQTPEEMEAAIKAVRDQLQREEEEERAKKAAKLAQEQQLKDELNKILPNG